MFILNLSRVGCSMDTNNEYITDTKIPNNGEMLDDWEPGI